MALVPNTALFIPITFTDGDGVLHCGQSWAQLILSVTKYRKKNNMPPGDPEREVLVQACEKSPDRCVETSTVKLPALEDDLNLRVLDYLIRVLEEPHTYVDEEEARRRIEICAACPRQREWRGKCGSCAARADKLVGEILGDHPVKFSKNLLGCSALSEDPRVAVRLQRPAIGDGKLPSNCWRK